MERRTFIKNSGMAAGFIAASPVLKQMNFEETYDFPLLDLHVHTTNEFTIQHILELGEKRKVKFGIVEHPIFWALKNDEDLKNYIDNLRKYPVFVGLQPTYIGWHKNYSPELLAKVDYILMDPQTIPVENGAPMQIWQFDTYVENTEEFMERYMDYSLKILKNEPINIFAWPLFLPVCIARDYYTLWTQKRMEQLIEAASARNIAFEINDMSHTPHEKFILMAKEAGIKFTLGSDSRNNNVGRLAYSKAIAKKCGLKADDFYVPVKKA